MSATPFVKGVITSVFDHFLVVTLPDGRALEVPRHAIEITDAGTVVRDDVETVRMFSARDNLSEQPVLVPASVVDRLTV
jgi:hypothetical protein